MWSVTDLLEVDGIVIAPGNQKTSGVICTVQSFSLFLCCTQSAVLDLVRCCWNDVQWNYWECISRDIKDRVYRVLYRAVLSQIPFSEEWHEHQRQGYFLTNPLPARYNVGECKFASSKHQKVTFEKVRWNIWDIASGKKHNCVFQMSSFDALSITNKMSLTSIVVGQQYKYQQWVY